MTTRLNSGIDVDIKHSWYRPGLLSDCAALVTGGGTGICRGIALALAARGLRRRDHQPEARASRRRRRRIWSAGVRSMAVSGDVRKPADVDAVVRRDRRRVRTARHSRQRRGRKLRCPAENLSPNGFGTVVDIDLKGTFNVSRAAFPFLQDAMAGVVLNISATLQLLGTVGQSHASAAKAGIDALTRTLAAEWGPAGIRVNGLAPGPVDGTEGVRRLTTDATAAAIEQGVRSAGWRRSTRSRTRPCFCAPMPRPSSPV